MSSAEDMEKEEEEDTLGDMPMMPMKGCLKKPSPNETSNEDEPVRVGIFLKRERNLDPDAAAFVLDLENGMASNVGEIKSKMFELLDIPSHAAHLFTIWLISPHLELQLKYHHRPFTLRKQWTNFLSKYADCEEEEAELDEPVLTLQRNCFIPVEEERKLTDPVVLKLLFEEATYNVLQVNYPIPVADAEKLGGILLRCYWGKYDKDVNKPGTLKSSLNDLLPYYAIGSNKISQFLHSSNIDSHLLQEYESASKKHNELPANELQNFYLDYLEYCRGLPFYGAAFFRGSLFQEGSDYKIWKKAKSAVTVGVNRYGLTLFKSESEEIYSFLPYGEFSWDYRIDEDEMDEKGHNIQRFVIEYDGSNGPRQIQIITKQACLIDAMAQSCLRFINEIDFLSFCKKIKIDKKKLQGISYDAPIVREMPPDF